MASIFQAPVADPAVPHDILRAWHRAKVSLGVLGGTLVHWAALGVMLAATAILGAIDVVFGECDR